MQDNKRIRCCICNKSFYGHGNNPAPVKHYGRCCNECNTEKVIPARISEKTKAALNVEAIENGAETKGIDKPSIPTVDNNINGERQQGVIESLLNRGEENAMRAETIMDMIGERDRRKLSKMIESERHDGAMILSSGRGGYYLPADGEKGRAEMRRHLAALDSRAKSTLAVGKPVREALKVIEGQTEMK